MKREEALHRVWEFPVERYLELPKGCRRKIVSMVDDDVALCFRNNGPEDEICKKMYDESLAIREVLL
jgi:hypothetical protein